jgi:Holliday junction resolvase-like predicted endonuclease
LAAGAVVLSFVVLRVRSWVESVRVRRRLRRGVRGQRRARTYLEQLGFDILAEEHELSAEMEVDGELMAYTLRIDYLVQKRRRTYGVEVKTGEQAGDPCYRATRRQLLEYSQALPVAVDGLLLLDMEQRRLMEVRFPGLERRPRRPPASIWVALGFVMGAAAWALLGCGCQGF